MKRWLVWAVLGGSVNAFALNPSGPFRPGTMSPLWLADMQQQTGNTPHNTLKPEEMKYVGKALKWSKFSLLMLGCNATAMVLTFTLEDPLVGGIMGITSLAGWSLTNGMTAFAFRDLAFSLKKSGSTAPSPKGPWFASIGGASFAFGAITGIGMIFADDTGTAITLAGICGTISWISGIVGIISTHSYAGKINYSKATDGYRHPTNRDEMVFNRYDRADQKGKLKYLTIPLATVEF